MDPEDFARLVEQIPRQVPRAELDEFRSAIAPPRAGLVEDLVREAVRGRPDPGLEELLASFRRGDATASLLLAHPRVRDALRRRTQELLDG